MKLAKNAPAEMRNRGTKRASERNRRTATSTFRYKSLRNEVSSATGGSAP